jgi:putative ABC transport system permease protein
VVGLTAGWSPRAVTGSRASPAAMRRRSSSTSPASRIRLERQARRARADEIDFGRTQPGPCWIAPRASRSHRRAPGTGDQRRDRAPDARRRPRRVQRSIERLERRHGLHAAQQEELLLKGSVDRARRQILLFRVLLTIISAVIMALIIYTLTLDKLHPIALLKLIGAPNTSSSGSSSSSR